MTTYTCVHEGYRMLNCIESDAASLELFQAAGLPELGDSQLCSPLTASLVGLLEESPAGNGEIVMLAKRRQDEEDEPEDEDEDDLDDDDDEDDDDDDDYDDLDDDFEDDTIGDDDEDDLYYDEDEEE
ncbi:MAG: hypothetical protein HKL96_00130 [Phycisphaerales bacterium]|nr:hypothetical protein [Phycisphaerales bacterium]